MLTLNFDEVMNASSFLGAGITLQSAKQAATEWIELTDMTSFSNNGLQIAAVLTRADVDRVTAKEHLFVLLHRKVFGKASKANYREQEKMALSYKES